VVTFMMGDEQFPRSISYCLNQIVARCAHLPKGKDVIERTQAIKEEIDRDLEAEEFGAEFRDDLNELQVSLGELHALIQKTWFLSDQ